MRIHRALAAITAGGLAAAIAMHRPPSDERARPAASTARATVRPARPGGPAPALGNPAPSARAAPEPPPETAARSGDNLLAAAEQRYQRAASDPADATANDRAEHQLVSLLPAGSRVRVVSCRRSICRAELEHADLDHHRAFLQRATSPDAEWIGPMMAGLSSLATASPVVSVVYLGRDPTALGEPVAIEELDMPPGD